MIKKISIFAALLCMYATLSAQMPDAVNYQAVARDLSGTPLVNRNITVKISILKGSSTGNVYYSELHSITTDGYGMFSLKIGRGMPVTNTFEDILWFNADQWLQVELDPNGGSNYFLMGTAELVSVPYAFAADTADHAWMMLHELEDVDSTGLQTGYVIKWDGNNWVPRPDSSGSSVYAGNGINISGDTISNAVWSLNSVNDAYRYTGSAVIGDSVVHPSAIFELNSTDKGFLFPRLTTGQRNGISNPANGLTIYNTTDSTLEYFNGQCWIRVYERSCDECRFTLSMSNSTGTITRPVVDTAGTDITVTQTNTTPQITNLYLIHNLPVGATATLNNSSITGSGTIRLTVQSNLFATAGTYPVAVQAVCGDVVRIVTFNVTITPCYEVTISSNQVNYDLQAANNLPGIGTPICVFVKVDPGVIITSNSTGIPAFTTGALDPNSQVAILNNGYIIGKGGDGGDGDDFNIYGDPGEDGGHAIELTVPTQIDNTSGFLYGGGGGGGGVGVSAGTVPVVNISVSAGAGGGGGAGGGLGGNSTVPTVYDPGTDGTSGISGQGGQGGGQNIPINIPVAVVATLTVTPSTDAGEGGNYGLDGTSGTATLLVEVSVPVFGTVFSQSFPVNPPTFPAGGTAGNAVKRNGNPLTGLNDGNYQTSNLKGRVGP